MSEEQSTPQQASSTAEVDIPKRRRLISYLWLLVALPLVQGLLIVVIFKYGTILPDWLFLVFVPIISGAITAIGVRTMQATHKTALLHGAGVAVTVMLTCSIVRYDAITLFPVLMLALCIVALSLPRKWPIGQRLAMQYSVVSILYLWALLIVAFWNFSLIDN